MEIGSNMPAWSLWRRRDRGCEARIKGNGGEQRFLVAGLKRLVG